MNKDILGQYKINSREERVLRLIMEGYSILEMVQELGMPESTVKYHTKALFDKTGTDTRAKLMVKMWTEGWGFSKPVVQAQLMPGELPRGRV